MTRKQQITYSLLWAATILAAAIGSADPFFTTILLPVLASSGFLIFERPHRCCWPRTKTTS
jgi:hypothetical protein